MIHGYFIINILSSINRNNGDNIIKRNDFIIPVLLKKKILISWEGIDKNCNL